MLGTRRGPRILLAGAGFLGVTLAVGMAFAQTRAALDSPRQRADIPPPDDQVPGTAARAAYPAENAAGKKVSGQFRINPAGLTFPLHDAVAVVSLVDATWALGNGKEVPVATVLLYGITSDNRQPITRNFILGDFFPKPRVLYKVRVRIDVQEPDGKFKPILWSQAAYSIRVNQAGDYHVERIIEASRR
jgi:hypothetical protein